MNYKKFAEQWYEGAPANEDNTSQINGLATAIKMSFVSWETILELRKRCKNAVKDVAYLHMVDYYDSGETANERLSGKIEGMELVLSYLLEMEATE